MTTLAMLLGGEKELRCQEKMAAAYRSLARTFGLADLSEGFLVELHRQAGEWDAAAEHFALYVDQLLAPLPCPDPDLFAPGLDCEKKPGGTFPAGMRRMLLENIRRDINAPELLEHPVFAAALKKLEGSV